MPVILQGVDGNVVGDTLSRWVDMLRPARPTLPAQGKAAADRDSSGPLQQEVNKG